MKHASSLPHNLHVETPSHEKGPSAVGMARARLLFPQLADPIVSTPVSKWKTSSDMHFPRSSSRHASCVRSRSVSLERNRRPELTLSPPKIRRVPGPVDLSDQPCAGNHDSHVGSVPVCGCTCAASASGLVVKDEAIPVSSSESGEDDEALCLAVVGSAQESDQTAVLERELDEMIAAGVREEGIDVAGSTGCASDRFFGVEDLVRAMDCGGVRAVQSLLQSNFLIVSNEVRAIAHAICVNEIGWHAGRMNLLLAQFRMEGSSESRRGA